MGFWNIVITNPAVLAGGLALFVPYLVHLLTRRTPRRLVFPTVRFIRRAEASHSALFKLRDILLLLVRTALVALLFLVFLKPVLHAAMSAPDAKAHAAAVIVLDRSLSMGYAGTGFTPFARGQLAAGQIVDHLGAQDVGNLVLAGATPVASFEKPAANKFALRRDIQNASASLERADLDAAIAEAVRQLAPERNRRATLYFVSDFQRSNWAAVNFKAIPKDVETVFVPVNEAHPWNLAVTEVAIDPPVPVVSEDVDITCSIGNYGGSPERVPVSLALHDIAPDDDSTQNAPLQREVEVQPGATASVSFRLRPLRPGRFEGTVRIGADGLSADDARYFTLHVADRVDVVLLTDRPPRPGGSATNYLLRAMEPSGSSRPGERGAQPLGTFRPIVLASREFNAARAADAQIVVVDEAGPFSESLADALTKYVRDGGAVLYFLSSPQDGANLSALAGAAKGALALPFATGPAMDYRLAGQDAFATFAEANFDEPMLRRFREDSDLGAAHFYRALSTQRIAGQGEILIRYNDGTIALARSSYGAGSLLLCNFDVSREGSDLARKTVFVPLLHELLKGMRPHESGRRDQVVGFAAAAQARLSPAASDVQFINPARESVSASIEQAGEIAAVIFPVTAAPGFYRILQGGREAGAAAVNVDARESDLDALTVEQLNELVRGAQRPFASVDGADAESVQRYLEGRPLWPYLMLAALALLGIEQVLLLALRR